jgi:hypothetical protein
MDGLVKYVRNRTDLSVAAAGRLRPKTLASGIWGLMTTSRATTASWTKKNPPLDENRDSAGNDERVRCSRRGKWILMHDTRCKHCGLHFQGEA